MMVPSAKDCQYIWVRNHPKHLEFARLVAEHECAAYPAWAAARSQIVRNLASRLTPLPAPRGRASCYLVEATGGLPALPSRERRNVAVILYNCDQTFFDFPRLPNWKRRIFQSYLKDVDGFLSPTAYMEDLAKQWYPNAKHAVFDLYAETSTWGTFRYCPENVDFLYVGRLDAYKNQALLIEAFKEIRRRHSLGNKLVFLGNVHPDYRATIEPMLDPTISISGWVDRPWEKIPSSAGYYFNLARHEPSGTNILEMLAAGIPTIVSEGCGYKEILRQIDPHLVVPLDLEAVIKAWEYLHFELGRDGREQLSMRLKQEARSWTRERAIDAFRSAWASMFDPA